MVRSMTGYGKGVHEAEERRITAELRSVNNRYFDCTVKMPRTFLFAEDTIKKRVQSAVSRGKVDVFVTVETKGGGEDVVTVNESLAEQYIAAFTRLKEQFSLKDDLTVSLVARQPDVLTLEKKDADDETLLAELCAALDAALADYNTMREQEGKKLAEDILGRAQSIETMTGQVEEQSPKTVADYHARLAAKMQEVLESKQLDESRILTEAAIFADKVAVDEETVRLRSHLAQLRTMLEQGGPVGRKLDFLIQEFNRETNTIGSKCNDLAVTKLVVDMKAEIEKIREQVQNLE